MPAFDEGVDDALMAGFARFRQVAKMNFTFGVGVGRNATMGLGFVRSSRVAAVTFLARHAYIFVL